jgi:uncharacterized protein YjcR
MCAKAGITAKTLRTWRDEEGLDITDEAAVMDRAARKQVGNPESEDATAAKLRKVRAEADMLEHKLQVERGKFVSHESQLRAGMQFGLVIRGVFERMDSDLTPRLAGRKASECSKILKEYARDKLTELSLYESDIKISAD